MNYVERSIGSKVLSYAGSFPCTLVTGARQVGKSTLLAHHFKNSHRSFVFDPVDDIYGIRSDPDLFLKNNPPPLILDEIQYVSELVPAIKRAVDLNRKPGMYLITGSQQWEVMRRLAESLAGRVGILELPGFSLAEKYTSSDDWLLSWLDAHEHVDDLLDILTAKHSLRLSATKEIWRGGFPEVQTLSEDVVPGWMRGYVSTYLQRDVRMLLDVRDEMQFSAFLSLCASLTAQECNYSQLGRDIGLTSPTVKRWLGILRGTFQWLEVPAFSGNRIKRLSEKPKGYFSDTGLACYLMRISSEQAVQGHPAFGALFESMVVTDIHKRIQALPLPPSMYHYRQHSGAEVDLLLEKDGKFYPLEVKATTRIHPKHTRSIKIFQEIMGRQSGTGVVVYAGDEVRKLGESCIAVPFDLL